MMTTTNQCDLEEAKRLAIQKLVELSHEDGWKGRSSGSPTAIITLVFQHEWTGMQIRYIWDALTCNEFYDLSINDLNISVENYLSVKSYHGEPERKPPPGPIKQSFTRIQDRIKKAQEQTRCHEIMAALGRIKS